jgi:hypothetical protein
VVSHKDCPTYLLDDNDGIIVARLGRYRCGNTCRLLSLFINVYRFLAITHRVNTDMLVIDGRVHEYAITAGADEFQAGAYHHLLLEGPQQDKRLS